MKKEAIIAVQEYFKEKLLNGEFEFIEFSEHITTVAIDQDYIFLLWTANGSKHLKIYENRISTMNLAFTEIEQKIIWGRLEKTLTDWRNGDLRSQKLEIYNRLKKELELEDQE